MLLRLLVLLLVLAGSDGRASLPLDASLPDLACGADHILVGRVVGVDMVDGMGRAIRDAAARTGPGSKNQIRLIVSVEEVIDSTAVEVPKNLKVPLDPFMHYTLGNVQAAHAEPSEQYLVFLRGELFQPVVAGRFLWSLDERAEALLARKHCRSENR